MTITFNEVKAISTIELQGVEHLVDSVFDKGNCVYLMLRIRKTNERVEGLYNKANLVDLVTC